LREDCIGSAKAVGMAHDADAGTTAGMDPGMDIAAQHGDVCRGADAAAPGAVDERLSCGGADAAAPGAVDERLICVGCGGNWVA
jgi:hypothetical protein